MERNRVIKKHKRALVMAIVLAVVGIVFLVFLTMVIIPKQKMSKAMELLDSGDYDAAYALLEEIGNDGAIISSKLDRAVALIDSGEYDAANVLIDELGDSDAAVSNRYDRADALINSGDYVAAYMLLNGLDYKDSTDKAVSIKPQYQKLILAEAQVGSCVFFGAYEQDNDTADGKEDIEWLVLQKNDNSVLLISRYALDCQVYNTAYTGVTWESSSLREWMNETFISDAFNSDEQNLIQTTTVTAEKNPYFPGTVPGNDTSDKVFLLSIREAHNYFGSDTERQCQGTAYCYEQGASEDDEGNCMWWLRSPGHEPNYAASVGNDGAVLQGGCGVDYFLCAVRPAIWISVEP